MMEIKAVWITTRPPRGDDPGACEIGHYKVENDMVVMCREDGRPTGKKVRLAPGDDAQKIAGRLTRESFLRREPESAFNRPLNYAATGWR
jgi:hypothetical protein